VAIDPEGRLLCSCRYHQRYGVACRHIIAINQGELRLEHVAVRWLSRYAAEPNKTWLFQPVELPTSLVSICDFPICYDGSWYPDDDGTQEIRIFGSIGTKDGEREDELQSLGPDNGADPVNEEDIDDEDGDSVPAVSRHHMVQDRIDQFNRISVHFKNNSRAARWYCQVMDSVIGELQGVMEGDGFPSKADRSVRGQLPSLSPHPKRGLKNDETVERLRSLTQQSWRYEILIKNDLADDLRGHSTN